MPLAAAAAAVAVAPLPPGLLLYGASGVAAWLVWRRIDVGLERKRAALRLWGWQLLLSGLWQVVLAWSGHPGAAAGSLLATLLLAWASVAAFRTLRPNAAILQLVYVVWLCWEAASAADRFWPGQI